MKSCFLIKGFTLKSYKVLLMQGRIKHFVTSHLGLFFIYQLKNLLVTASACACCDIFRCEGLQKVFIQQGILQQNFGQLYLTSLLCHLVIQVSWALLHPFTNCGVQCNLTIITHVLGWSISHYQSVAILSP